ncbi:hypothetical protein [Brevibacillus borstelensis]|uniref:hypothetical protein n=1 Tax=Brevibacillus borstelensis TaxID=45462 RepID=UPI0004698920|nr:hypothetical protein [Brevibacillus borstelensis]MCM3473432.1 hypothetical protein [Brevibacillus borstelensis]MCM3561972.1 hypothetical protein [Brevibacillus borstelensis]MCM3593617.1 hypothetical protein [Brevibacillus borstelensis]MED1855056.1 hypothetical protein [Brevibacillus borstelensis]
MLTHVESGDIKARLTIYKTDIDKKKFQAYLDDVNKIEGLKRELVKGKVELTIYFIDGDKPWHNFLDIRLWLYDFIKQKPQMLYYLTDNSLGRVFTCLIKGENLKKGIAEDKQIQSFIDKAVEYCASTDEKIELANRIEKVTGYKSFGVDA